MRSAGADCGPAPGVLRDVIKGRAGSGVGESSAINPGCGRASGNVCQEVALVKKSASGCALIRGAD